MSYPIKATALIGAEGVYNTSDTTGCIGVVSFEQTSDDATTIEWDVKNCGNDTMHGFHIHEKADFSNGCGGGGGHYNPHTVDHGARNASSRHVGDLGNIAVDADGNGVGSVVDALIKLKGTYSVLGRSVVLHAGEDDLGLVNNAGSKSTGNAGSRQACGVISAVSTVTPAPTVAPTASAADGLSVGPVALLALFALVHVL